MKSFDTKRNTTIFADCPQEIFTRIFVMDHYLWWCSCPWRPSAASNSLRPCGESSSPHNLSNCKNAATFSSPRLCNLSAPPEAAKDVSRQMRTIHHTRFRRYKEYNWMQCRIQRHMTGARIQTFRKREIGLYERMFSRQMQHANIPENREEDRSRMKAGRGRRKDQTRLCQERPLTHRFLTAQDPPFLLPALLAFVRS